MRLPKQTRISNVGVVERVASAAGGAALAYYGVQRRDPLGVGLAAVGGSLVLRGATGYSPVWDRLGVSTRLDRKPYDRSIKITKSLTINRPIEQLYAFWRNLANLPRFMRNLDSVELLDGTRSRWVARGPANKRIEWDAELIAERPNEMIGWRTVDGSWVEHAGSVRFELAPAGRGAVVRVNLQYNPPGGKWGDRLSRVFGADPDMQIEEDLRRFKQLMEAGEVPTTEGQPAGRRAKPPDRAAHVQYWEPKDLVETASDESFPASDAPAWTGVTSGEPTR